MHKFTSNIPLIVNNISTMQDVSAQNMDLSGSLDVSQNTTIGGDLSVAGDVVVAGDLTAENLIVGSTNVITELTSLDTRLDTEEQKTTALQTLTASHTEDITANTNNIASLDVDLFFSTAKLASANTFTANQSITGDLSVTEATALSSLSVSGNETVGGTLGVTNTTTLTGNVGIGGASGSHNLLVTGSERITGNLDVSGDLNVTGNFNFSEVIQNITTVNNEVIISTQLDISNQGTGPALKVSQFGVGEDQDVAVFNAGDEGDAFKIDYAGNSHFYKPVEMNQTFDTILIRRTDAVGGIINLRTLQVFVNGVNILPSSTNSTQSIQSGSIGNVIEFMTWNNSVVSGAHTRASNIRLNNVETEFSVASIVENIPPYISLYIPLTQSFSISDVQSVVLYNRAPGSSERINGFQIELYNRSSGFTPGVNVLYTMPINTIDFVYRFDLPSIYSYTGFSSVDSTDKIKTVTVSSSSFNTTLLKVDGNVEFGGGLSVDGTLQVNGGITFKKTEVAFDTIVFRRPTGVGTGRYPGTREVQLWVNNVNVLPTLVTSSTFNVYGTPLNDISNIPFFINWVTKTLDLHGNNAQVSNVCNNNINDGLGAYYRGQDGDLIDINVAMYIPMSASMNLYDIQSIVLYNRVDTNYGVYGLHGVNIELYNRQNDPTLTNPIFSTGQILSYLFRNVYRFDFSAISTFNKDFSLSDSTETIIDYTKSGQVTSNSDAFLKVEGGKVQFESISSKICTCPYLNMRGHFVQYIGEGLGDGASLTLGTMTIKSWWGIRFLDWDDVCRMYINPRTGTFHGTIASTSDDRVKKNEKYIVDSITTLMKLKPQTYDKYHNLDCSGDYVFESGLIAQEIYYDAPELRHLVYVSEDISGDITSSNEPSIDPDYSNWGSIASVNYNGFIAYLIKAIQEQQEIIDEEKTKTSILQTQYNDLLSRISALENSNSSLE